eukprot:22514-Eustigmatos_ZCMA.PRE.1
MVFCDDDGGQRWRCQVASAAAKNRTGYGLCFPARIFARAAGGPALPSDRPGLHDRRGCTGRHL